jgi:hypothetical protein
VEGTRGLQGDDVRPRRVGKPPRAVTALHLVRDNVAKSKGTPEWTRTTDPRLRSAHENEATTEGYPLSWPLRDRAEAVLRRAAEENQLDAEEVRAIARAWLAEVRTNDALRIVTEDVLPAQMIDFCVMLLSFARQERQPDAAEGGAR